jgi:hypothetical protein
MIASGTSVLLGEGVVMNDDELVAELLKGVLELTAQEQVVFLQQLLAIKQLSDF